MDMNIYNKSDEDYVIKRAKEELKTNPLSAKAWMLTAKTLYPNNFSVQFEAYKVEKFAGNVKESARCFSDLIGKFQQQPEFWEEINNVTIALRSENEAAEAEKIFLCEMFKHIAPDVQHKLLLLTADHCEDTEEHCKLLLLLLQKFPGTIGTHGSRLVETLLSAEKHSVAGNNPVNCFRKLLVCELLPLLHSSTKINLDLQSKLILKLLHKSIEYHLSLLNENFNKTKDSKNDDIWSKIFLVIEFIGSQLNWEPYLISFNNNWSKEIYWQKLLAFCHSQSLNLEDGNLMRQIIYCLTLFFLYCIYQYGISLNGNCLLIEAFTDPNLPTPQSNEGKSKRRKPESDTSNPYLTTDIGNIKGISSNFLIAVNCWDLLHSTDLLTREFVKLTSSLMVETWLTNFLIDYLVYKRNYEEATILLDKDESLANMNKHLLKASFNYLQNNYIDCFDMILQTLPLLPTIQGTLSNQLTIGGSHRHLHFLHLTRISILQYITKLLVRSILDRGLKSDNAVGHCLVLIQFDWPAEEEILSKAIDAICVAHSFSYFPFQTYVIQADILEEIAYLASKQGGQIPLEIVPNIQMRRMGTRGADKGLREEIKQAIRRQLARSNEVVYDLIYNFMVQEAKCIKRTLM